MKGNPKAVNAIEEISIGGLVPYARNSRTHSPQQVAEIAASIREFGFTSPVLIADDGTIIAGHGRVQAAQSLGLVTVPCIKLSHLSETQRRAYVIADNRLALNAGWDEEMLAVELGGLRDDGFDVGVIGFDDAEIAGILEDPLDPQDEPDAAAVPVRSAPGSVWRVGDQWFICGDSSDRSIVDLGLGGRDVGAVVFDPEFHEDFGAWGLGQYSPNDVFIFGDCLNRTHERVAGIPGEWRFQFVWEGVTRHIVKGWPLLAHKTSDWYSVAPSYNHDGWFDPREGAQAAQDWTNAKGSTSLPGNPKGKRLASVFRSPVTDESHGVAKHGKPVLWLSMILANCSSGLVLDLFSGTGAVSCACARIGRPSVAVEVDPARLDYGIARTEVESGIDAVMVRGGGG